MSKTDQIQQNLQINNDNTKGGQNLNKLKNKLKLNKDLAPLNIPR